MNVTNNQRFERLLEPVHDRALHFARGLCRSVTDGDDLFQEAMLRAYRKLDQLRDDGAFRTWLFRILITLHRKRARRAFWARFLPLGEAAASAGEAHTGAPGDYRVTAEAPDAGDATARARAALAILPAEQREAIVLFEMEGWTVGELAELFGTSASAIKSRLARGRDRLRAYYERELGTVPTTQFANGETR